MTLRRFLVVAALAAAPAGAADPAPPASGDTNATMPSPRVAVPRKPERTKPTPDNKPRIIEAPGAALMLIPAE